MASKIKVGKYVKDGWHLTEKSLGKKHYEVLALWAYYSKPENGLFRVRNLETWKIEYQFGLETGNGKPRFWKPRNTMFKTVWLLSLVGNQILIISNYWEIQKKKTEIEIWSESQVRNPKKWKTQKWEAQFRVYCNRPTVDIVPFWI